MGNDRISAGVIGLGSFGRQVLDALRAMESVEVVGISDMDRGLVEGVGAETSIPHFSDNRQMILRTAPRAVFMSIPPMQAQDLLGFCASRDIAVWKDAPLARNLGEAASFVRMFDKAGRQLAVGAQRRFMDSYRKLRELRHGIEDVFLSRAHYVFNWGDKLGWRGSRVSSGGGALLELGFHMADLLVWTLGLPEEVYGVAACRRPRESIDLSKPAYDTDDTAAATLRYGDDSVVSLVTSRVSGPYSEGLVLCGRGGSLAADAETCVFRDPAGEIKDRFQESCPPGDVFLRQVRSFITSVHSESSRYSCPASESLLAHAVIDSIYLAGRTCQPENPWKQLHLHGVGADECLGHSVKGEIPPVK